MNLLEFAIETNKILSETSAKNFAKTFIDKRTESFHRYHNGIVTSTSHGISYFDNVIKYWDNPDGYYTPDKKLKNLVDYEMNFVKILKLNKI